MTKKLYKTALGQTIDMDAVQNLNAEVIAVGNMYVNARGDELGPGGKIVRTRNEVMKEHYKKLHTMVPQDPAKPAPDAIEDQNGGVK